MIQKNIHIALFLLATINANAQTQQFVVGKEANIKLSIKEIENVTRCNVDVFIDGEGSFQSTIIPPNSEIIYTPQKVGLLTLRWEGKFKRAGLNSIMGCPGDGVLKINVVSANDFTNSNNSQPRQNWTYLTKNNDWEFFYDPSSVTGEIYNKLINIYIKTIGDPKDGVKSRIVNYSINCKDRDYIAESMRDFNDSDAKNEIKISKFPNGTNRIPIRDKTIAASYARVACDEKIQNQAQSSQTSQNPSVAAPTSYSTIESNLKYVPKLTEKELNTQIIKKAFTETQIGIFLQTYAFIWNAHDFVNGEHNEVSSWWSDTGQYWHRNLLPYKDNINRSMISLERTIDVISKNLGINSIKFKEAIGIFEYIKKDFRTDCARKAPGEWRDNFGRDCDPPQKNLKTLNSGTISDSIDRNRDDITSNGISEGFQFFSKYISENNLRVHNFEEKKLSKNDNRHPGIELHPRVFFDYYSKWFPEFFADQISISNIKQIANSVEIRLAKAAQDRESLLAQKADEERKRQEFLKSPAGQKQIAAEKEAERQRQIQFSKEFPYFAEVTCNNGGYGNFQIHACFTSSRNVLFELRNGSEYKFFTLPDIMELAAHSKDNNESIIDLMSNFQLKM